MAAAAEVLVASLELLVGMELLLGAILWRAVHALGRLVALIATLLEALTLIALVALIARRWLVWTEDWARVL